MRRERILDARLGACVQERELARADRLVCGQSGPSTERVCDRGSAGGHEGADKLAWLHGLPIYQFHHHYDLFDASSIAFSRSNSASVRTPEALRA